MTAVQEASVPEVGQRLSLEQRRAVEHGEGPLLIVAGAGTGKTTVITHRIAHLITSKKAKPSEILALTFTDAAAAEMEERVDVLVPYGFNDVRISTFHAFGDRILRDYAYEIGLSPDFKVMTQAEAAVFFNDNLYAFGLDYFKPRGNPTRFIQDIIKILSRAKDEDIVQKAYGNYAETKLSIASTPEEKEEAQKHLEIARAYVKYEELKAKHDLIDFGDQVWLALELLRTRPNVLSKVRKQFKYVLVDEFQDTNYVQFALVKAISEPHRNVTVVGDDDQSIYKFRGACLSNILGFMETYTGGKQVVINENYRSCQAILDSAYHLITHNNPERLEIKNGIDKRLKAVIPQSPLPPHPTLSLRERGRGEGGEGGGEGKAQRVTYKVFDTVDSESDAVAKWINEKVNQGIYSYKDIALLVRSNADADHFLRALNVARIPWIFSGATGLYRSPEVQLLVAFLSSVANPFDSASLYLLASSDLYQFPVAELARITNVASKSRRFLWEVVDRLMDYPELTDLSTDSIVTAYKLKQDILRYMEKAKELSTGQLLYAFLKDSGLLTRLAGAETARGVEMAQNIARFFEIVRQFGNLTLVDRVHTFVPHLKSLISAGDDPATAEYFEDINAVNVLTIHKAKGLEFPVVFMVCLVEGHFPVISRKAPVDLPLELVRDKLPSGDYHIQEERRLFYVGMTRAKHELHLSSAKNIGGKRTRRVSRFVLEALDMPGETGKPKSTSPVDQIERQAPGAASKELEDGGLLPIAPDEIITIKATAVDDYLTCPLKYKYVHVLRVPVLRHHAAIYGTAVHEAIQILHRAQMEKRKVSLDDVLNVFKSHWISEGFISREHEEERFTRGQEALKNYYNLCQTGCIAPKAVEEEFKFGLDGNLVVGRWDRVDEREGRTVIVDYKSSDVRSGEEAARRVKNSLQLKIYSLGYNHKYGKYPDRVELYFLESNVSAGTAPDTETMTKTENSILRAASGIRNREFKATPSYFACAFCAFQNICPAAAV